MVIKEIQDSLSNPINNVPRSYSCFNRTTREYEFTRAIPDNGPSPGPNKFTPHYTLVFKKSPLLDSSMSKVNVDQDN